MPEGQRLAGLDGDLPHVELAFGLDRRSDMVFLADRDAVAKAFIEHLCTYALRRVLTFDDKEDIDAIVAVAKKHDYRVKDIVRAVATSELRQKR